MHLVLGLFFISRTQAFERIPEPPRDNNCPSRNYDHLTRLLPKLDGYTTLFGIWSEAKRYNISESQYSGVCFEAFFHLGPSWSERDSFFEEMDPLVDYLMDNNATTLNDLPVGWKDVAPRTHLIFTSKTESLRKLTANASPETREFTEKVRELFANSWIELATNSKRGKDSDNWTDNIIVKVAELYKKLTSATKIDLERSMCTRNTFRWINEMDNYFSQNIKSFWKVVGLDLSALLKGNEYLSSFSLEEVKAKYENRAERINMPAQEYVDVCAKTFSVMALRKDENATWNNISQYFVEKSWGKTMLVSFNESSPLVALILSRWNFIREIPVIPILQNFLRRVEEDLLGALVQANNRAFFQRTEPINLLSTDTVEFHSVAYSLLERATCFHSVVESFIMRKIDDYDLNFLPASWNMRCDIVRSST